MPLPPRQAAPPDAPVAGTASTAPVVPRKLKQPKPRPAAMRAAEEHRSLAAEETQAIEMAEEFEEEREGAFNEHLHAQTEAKKKEERRARSKGNTNHKYQSKQNHAAACSMRTDHDEDEHDGDDGYLSQFGGE